jgi:hypothetical protein
MQRAVTIKRFEELLCLIMISIIFEEEALGWLGSIMNTPEEQV